MIDTPTGTPELTDNEHTCECVVDTKDACKCASLYPSGAITFNLVPTDEEAAAAVVDPMFLDIV